MHGHDNKPRFWLKAYSSTWLPIIYIVLFGIIFDNIYIYIYIIDRHAVRVKWSSIGRTSPVAKVEINNIFSIYIKLHAVLY